jgi:putative aldouronate transport system substrate-binding protein
MNRFRIVLVACAIAFIATAAAFAGGKQESGTQVTTLRYFIALGDKASQTVKSNAEIAAYQEMEKKTRVKIDWVHPSVGGEAIQQLNLMIASQSLPDLIYVSWDQFPGGLAKAINDNIVVKLNDPIAKNAPNFQKLLTNKDVSKQVRLDDGTIAMFPVVRDDPSVRVWFGPQIRKDWLDRLGLSIPKSIDDWYIVLSAFKQKDANGNGDAQDEIPFVSTKQGGLLNFSGAWGLVRLGFYMDGNTVKFGPMESAFNDFLSAMRKWYAEGLIDPDFAVTDGNGFSAKVTDNKAGSYYGSLAGNLGRFAGILQQKDPKASLVGVPWPTGPSGKPYQTESQHIGAVLQTGTAVSTKNKFLDASVKWLDYHYGEEGSMLLNFGIQGVSYEMKNGYPTFTDLIFKNPEKLPYDVALARYSLAPNTSEAMRQDPREYEQYSLRTDYQQAANKTWASGDTSLLIPTISPTVAESSILAKAMNDVNTYANEIFVKYVMGQEPAGSFPTYVANFKKLGIEKAIEIMQNAYDRYMKR